MAQHPILTGLALAVFAACGCDADDDLSSHTTPSGAANQETRQTWASRGVDAIKKGTFPEAASWFRKAAEQGDVKAQFALGLMYSKGLGVQQDKTLAYALLSLASASAKPDDNAIKARDLIAATLPPEEIDRGQRVAANWKVGTPLPRRSRGL